MVMKVRGRLEQRSGLYLAYLDSSGFALTTALFGLRVRSSSAGCRHHRITLRVTLKKDMFISAQSDNAQWREVSRDKEAT